MTETGLVALVGVLGTLVGTIGGAWIARRAALEQLRSQRYGEATDAARAVIVRLIIAGRQWRDSLIGITFELAQAESLADSEALRLASIGTDPHSGDAVTRGRIALGDALAGAQTWRSWHVSRSAPAPGCKPFLPDVMVPDGLSTAGHHRRERVPTRYFTASYSSCCMSRYSWSPRPLTSSMNDCQAPSSLMSR